jgi:hypothetical protein
MTIVNEGGQVRITVDKQPADPAAWLPASCDPVIRYLLAASEPPGDKKTFTMSGDGDHLAWRHMYFDRAHAMTYWIR